MTRMGKNDLAEQNAWANPVPRRMLDCDAQPLSDFQSILCLHSWPALPSSGRWKPISYPFQRGDVKSTAMNKLLRRLTRQELLIQGVLR